MFGKDINVVDILQIGVIGLGFLLAVLAYHLLTKEQKQNPPRSVILNSIYVFMFFSVVLCVIGIFSQIERFNDGQKENKTSHQEKYAIKNNNKNILYIPTMETISICATSVNLYFQKIYLIRIIYT